MKTTCDSNLAGSITSTKGTQLSAWETAVTAVATAWDIKLGKNADNVVALANVATA